MSDDATLSDESGTPDARARHPRHLPHLRLSRRSLTGAAIGIFSVAAVGVARVTSAFGMLSDAAESQDAAAQAFSRTTDDSISRSDSRTELSQALSQQRAAEREASLAEYNAALADDSVAARAELRDQASAAELKKVRATADKIAEEKREAEQRLEAMAKASGYDDASALNIDPTQLSPAGTTVAPMKTGTYSLGSGFGDTGSWARYHTGQDFVASTGTPVYATTDGITGSADAASGWAGTYIVIYHEDGSSNLYAHLSRKLVKVGEFVKAGQLIGYVGSTGRAFGSHLHFEYYPAGTTPGDIYTATNPITWLTSKGVHV